MASHHYHHLYQQQHQHQQQQQNYQPPTCHCCCSSQSNPSVIQSQSQSHFQTLDPLVQSIATQIIQSSQNHLYTRSHQQPLKKHYSEEAEEQQQQQQKQQKLKNQNQKETRLLLKSLVRRIEALESSSSLHNHHSPSLREVAARTIQTHFRAFMVRRSRTLRHLKELAFVKSSFNSLKSSVSGKTHVDPGVVSQKAMDLLLKLDSIQGGDPMIRDGKRSISGEIVRFLEFVEGVSVKRQQLYHHQLMKKNVKPVEKTNKQSRVSITRKTQVPSRRFGLNCMKTDVQGEGFEGFSRVSEDECEEEEVFQGFHPKSDHNVMSVKPKKSVSFVDNGVKRVVLSSTQEAAHSSEDDEVSIDELASSGDDQREVVGEMDSSSLCREAQDGDVEEEEEEGEDLDDEEEERKKVREFVKSEVSNGLMMSRHFESENGSFVFSPPAPVHMEGRLDDLMNKKVTMKRV